MRKSKLLFTVATVFLLLLAFCTVSSAEEATEAQSYSVRIPIALKEYTITPLDGNLFVEHGKSYSFRFTLSDGYVCTDEFAVKVNGKKMEPKSDGTYTVESVTENIVITVEGVKDITPPNVALTIGSFQWTSVIDDETSFIYTNTSGDIIIKADDKASGVEGQYVYISDYQLSSQELKSIYIWTDYESTMAIPVNTPKFVYVKVVDRAGNETYVGSDGVIFDNVAPKINLDEDTVYYGKTSLEIDDAFIDTIRVDGRLSSSSLTLLPRDEDYVITATDKAGNKTEKKIQVRKSIPKYVIPMDLIATVGQTLADVELPKQENGSFVWTQSTMSVGEVGKNTFMAIFIPNNTTDYQIVKNIPITLSVSYTAQKIPSGIEVKDETIAGIRDGALIGVKTGMEYRHSSETKWTPVVQDKAEGLRSGIYYVRYAATEKYQASAFVEVVIKEGKKLTVSFVIDGETVSTEKLSYGEPVVNIPTIPNKVGYNHVSPRWDVSDFSAITSDMTVTAIYTPNVYSIAFTESDRFTVRSDVADGLVKHGESYTFYIDMNKGYMPSLYFDVKNNGAPIYPDEDGKYVLENVAEAHTIEINGIVSSVKLEDIEIDGIYNKTYYAIGDKFVFSTVGAGLNNETPMAGDERYIPLSYSAYYVESWSEPPYSASFTLYKEGDCTLSIEFRREIFDGVEWKKHGENVTLSHTFYVNKLPAGLPTGNSMLSTIISVVLISLFTGGFIFWYMQKKKKNK